MTIGTVELVLGDAEQEDSRLEAMVARVIQAEKPLFLGRFLTDLSLPDAVLSEWDHSKIVWRQYGNSCYVNACPQLADAGRIEIGMEESEAALRSGKHEVVLLSQILTAIDEHLLTTADLVKFIDVRPTHVTLILTGSNAPAEILAKGELCN